MTPMCVMKAEAEVALRGRSEKANTWLSVFCVSLGVYHL